MQKNTSGVMLLVLISVACLSVREPSAQAKQDIYDICRVGEFAGASRAVDQLNPIYEPIIVRQVKGKITYPDWEGSWGDIVRPILELRGPGKSSKIYEVHGDATGRFELKTLPKGRYCFFASVSSSGYHGAYGIIVIDKKADPKKEIEIVLGLGAP